MFTVVATIISTRLQMPMIVNSVVFLKNPNKNVRKINKKKKKRKKKKEKRVHKS